MLHHTHTHDVDHLTLRYLSKAMQYLIFRYLEYAHGRHQLVALAKIIISKYGYQTGMHASMHAGRQAGRYAGRHARGQGINLPSRFLPKLR